MGSIGAAPGGVPAAKRPLRIWPWVVVLCAGLALGALGGGVFAFRSVSTLLSIVNGARETPASFTVHCEAGTYLVFEERSSAQLETVLPTDVVVTGPGGADVPTSVPGIDETRTLRGASFQNVVSFDATVSGTYRVVVDAHGQHVTVFVAPSLSTSLRHNLVWLVVGLLGIVPFLLGVTMVTVRAAQRSRRRARPPSIPRCANGHPAAATDRFCATCGAPVYPAGTMATYVR